MQATFENAVKTIESLSAQDYKRFLDWFRRNYDIHSSPPPKQSANLLPSEEEWPERAEKFRLAMKWIDEHRQAFLGQWVCLDGEHLISHGTDAKRVYQEARQAGIKIPFVERVEEEETGAVSEGWD